MAKPRKELHFDGDADHAAAHGFGVWAAQYYQCARDFRPPPGFSPVPYFLLCRAIELQLKALHLARKSEEAVKTKFGHGLVRAYEALNAADRTLTSAELKLLKAADAVYSRKGFEYFHARDALVRWQEIPSLPALDALARTILRLPPEDPPPTE